MLFTKLTLNLAE